VTGYFAAGASFGTGESGQLTPQPLATDEFFLAKLADDGTFSQLVTPSAQSGSSSGLTLAAVADGSNLVAGTFTDTITFGSTTLTGQPSSFLARFDASGSLSWAVKLTLPGSSGDSVDLVALPDGSSRMLGSFLDNVGLRTYFVVAYTGTGSLSWLRTFTRMSSGSSVLANGVGVFADGSCVVAGQFVGTVVVATGQPEAVTLSAVAATDAFLARFAADGTLAWAKPLPWGTMTNVASTALGLPDGTAVVAGYSASPAADVAMMGRYAVDGSLVWTHALPTNWGARIKRLAPTADGGFGLLGFFDLLNSSASVDFSGDGVCGRVVTAGSTVAMFLARYSSSLSVTWARSNSISFSNFRGTIDEFPDGGTLFVSPSSVQKFGP
jgi:hypothetical protein